MPVARAVLLLLPFDFRLLRDGDMGVGVGWGSGGGGRGRLYTYRYTVTTRVTPALRWAAMGAILIKCFIIVRDKVTRQCPQTTALEEKGEPKRIRTEVLLLTSLTTWAHQQACGLYYAMLSFTYLHPPSSSQFFLEEWRCTPESEIWSVMSGLLSSRSLLRK